MRRPWVGLARDLGETREDLGSFPITSFRKTLGECDALRATVCKLKERFATLCDAAMANGDNEVKMQKLSLQAAVHAKAIAHLTTLVKVSYLNCLRLTTQNCNLQRRGNELKRKPPETVTFA